MQGKWLASIWNTTLGWNGSNKLLATCVFQELGNAQRELVNAKDQISSLQMSQVTSISVYHFWNRNCCYLVRFGTFSFYVMWRMSSGWLLFKASKLWMGQIWNKIIISRPSKILGLPSTNFTWSILEYFVPYMIA